MPASESHDVTRLLRAWSAGEEEALDELLPIVYDNLRRIARHQMRFERPGHLLQSTALIHEAYIRLVDQRRVRWRNRAQFFAIASRVMRRILVDEARGRAYAKRGGRALRVSLHESAAVAGERSSDLVALDEALGRLEILDARQSRIVEMRFFGGMTLEEISEVMSLSPATLKREWSAAKAWLYHELSGH